MAWVVMASAGMFTDVLVSRIVLSGNAGALGLLVLSIAVSALSMMRYLVVIVGFVRLVWAVTVLQKGNLLVSVVVMMLALVSLLISLCISRWRKRTSRRWCVLVVYIDLCSLGSVLTMRLRIWCLKWARVLTSWPVGEFGGRLVREGRTLSFGGSVDLLIGGGVIGLCALLEWEIGLGLLGVGVCRMVRLSGVLFEIRLIVVSCVSVVRLCEVWFCRVGVVLG